MNIIELSKIAKEGDKLKSSIYQNAVCVWKNGVVYSGGSQINLWPLLQSEWEIIPPEPKVLSAEELINGNNWESLHHSSLSLNDQVRRDLHNIAEMGRDNGKLEMWLAFEKEYKSNYKSNWPSGITFECAVKKLKPNQSLEDLGE